MIFVTVGTHEQQFNRLIKKVDELKGKGVISDDVVMQIGFSTYKPQFCEYNEIISYDKMWNYVKKARIIITHGGPASFLMPLQVGKIPIVVPRQEKYSEHINDHQLDFVKQVSIRNNNIIPVYDVLDLSTIIKSYDEISRKKFVNVSEKNKVFNDKFESIVKKLLKSNDL